MAQPQLAIEPYNSWDPLERAAASETNPRIRTLLQGVRDHMEYEIKGQLDALMNTLTAEPIYHFWGNGEPMVIQGWDAVRGFYEGMMAAGGHQFEVVVERIVADENYVVTDGRVKQIYTKDGLAAMGVSDVDGKPVTSSALWMSDAQLVTIWPGDPDGKLVGEDIYFGQSPMTTLKPISSDALPDYHLALR